MGIATPVLDNRSSEDTYKQVLELAKHYCPELFIPDDEYYFDPDNPGLVILKLFSKSTEHLITQFNKIPDNHRIAFLDFAGIDLLPARPSRVPLTFYPSQGSRSCLFVPPCTKVASSENPDLIFETTKGLSVIPVKLHAVFSVNPWEDKYTDHSEDVSGEENEFLIFGRNVNEKPLDHILFLGDDTLLDIRRPPTKLTIHLEGDKLSKAHFSHWYDGSGNYVENPDISDIIFDEDARIEKLDIALLDKTHKNIGKLERSNVDGTESFWLSVRPQEGLIIKGMKLPAISRISVDLTVEDIFPESAYFNNMPLDVKKGFQPYGEDPKKGDTLYLSSEEAFSKKGARITFDIESETLIEDVDVELQWEYWNGNGWELLDVADESRAFTQSGNIVLEICPDIQTLEINGQFNKWLRIRMLSEDAYKTAEDFEPEKKGLIRRMINKIKKSLAKISEWIKEKILAEKVEEAAPKKPGPFDRLISSKIRRLKNRTSRKVRVKIFPRWVYGPRGIIKPKHTNFIRRLIPKRIKFIKSKLRGFLNKYFSFSEEEFPVFTAPFIKSMKISYSYKDSVPGKFKTFNNFQYNRLSLVEPEEPYRQWHDEAPCIYLGFEENITSLPMTLFFHIKDRLFNEEQITINDPAYQNKYEPQDEAISLSWEYYDERSWKEFTVKDETESFKSGGIINLMVPPDISNSTEFGKNLYWIKAKIDQGMWVKCPSLNGIFQNTVWALNNATFRDEVLGSGNGEPDITFSFSNKPLLEGQIIEVLEFDIPTKDELKKILSEKSEDAIRIIEDGEQIREVWVRWDEVSNFALSGPLNRHYVLDRAEGTITFGDGINGMVPPKGMNNICARYYKSGGGTQGDIPARTVTSLKRTIPNIDRVINHAPSSGGMDPENRENAINRAPHTIKTRDRAVTKEDFEWLAKEASQYVARAVCTLKSDTVTVVIIPKDDNNAPLPNSALLRTVKAYLQKRAFLPVLDRIDVVGPVYNMIDVYVNVKPVLLEESAKVSEMIKNRLFTFLHPLHGGPSGEGWDFGQSIAISQMAAVIEDIDRVDYVKEIVLTKIVAGQTEESVSGIEQLSIEQNALPCAGSINIEIAG